MKLRKCKNWMSVGVMLSFCVFFFTGCVVTNVFNGKDDKATAHASVGDVPDDVPTAITIKATPEECKTAIRQILQRKFGAGIALISEEFIKTDKTPLADSRSFKTGQTFCVFEISLSETADGNTRVEPVVFTYYKGSVMAEEKVNWPKVSNGLCHKLFMALLEKFASA